MPLVNLLIALGSAFAGGMRWLMGYEQRLAGKTQASLFAAMREAYRAKRKKRIDAETSKLGADDLGRRLRGE